LLPLPNTQTRTLNWLSLSSQRQARPLPRMT